MIAVGNRSRGDDALGPLFLERLEAQARPGLRLIEDFQLQIEHALALKDAAGVVFVDAAWPGQLAFENAVLRFEGGGVFEVAPSMDPASAFSHALSPSALLGVYVRVEGRPPPPAWVLAIEGEGFELGQPPSAKGLAHLEAALACFPSVLTRAAPRSHALRFADRAQI